MRDVIDDIKEAFLTGVSYMLPFVVAGGILVALGFLLGGYNIPSVEPYGSTKWISCSDFHRLCLFNVVINYFKTFLFFFHLFS